jgi:3-methyl-2-oxobutanoate hydroxymethyltransferase
MSSKKITAPSIFSRKASGEKITALTAADFITAKLLDEAGVDIILVGDSLGTTLLGYESTVSVSMREMIHHAKAVTRAKPKALVVADLPFGSYGTVEQALRNATRLVREGGVDAVKLEGGVTQASKIEAIVFSGIPVMGHLGLLPQSVLNEGGYHVQGKNPEQIKALENDLKAIEKAGAFACVFEYVKASVSAKLTRKSKIPSIGIGSGKNCDGQVLVTSDLLGLQSWLNPKAARKYANLGDVMMKAFKHYKTDVQQGKFPGERESFE